MDVSRCVYFILNLETEQRTDAFPFLWLSASDQRPFHLAPKAIEGTTGKAEIVIRFTYISHWQFYLRFRFFEHKNTLAFYHSWGVIRGSVLDCWSPVPGIDPAPVA